VVVLLGGVTAYVQPGIWPRSGRLVARPPIRATPPSLLEGSTDLHAMAPPVLPAIRPHTKWTATWGNVRAGPAITAAVIQVLQPGQPVDVGDRSNGWWAVQRDGRRVGYIANAVLRDEPTVPKDGDQH